MREVKGEGSSAASAGKGTRATTLALRATPPEEGKLGEGGNLSFMQTSEMFIAGAANKEKIRWLPYNPALRERAKELRKAGNLSEVRMWHMLHKRNFKGLDFTRQKIIGNFIVDFYCAACGVVIEIDGSSHDNKQEYDAERDAFLEGLGLTVIHVPAEEVLKDVIKVVSKLSNHPAFL